MIAALLWAALATAAPPPPDEEVSREELLFLGWGQACRAGLALRTYPRLGLAPVDEPVWARVLEASVPPGGERASLALLYEASGEGSWSPRAYAAALERLRKAGLDRPGQLEEVSRDAALPGPAEVLSSTTSLALRGAPASPGRGWRLARAWYHPLGGCVLLGFESAGSPRRWRFWLARSDEPGARRRRARARVENARLHFSRGNPAAAAREAANAAAMAPEDPLVLYHLAAVLALRGEADPAAETLARALRLDPARRAAAREDPDFAALRERDDVRRLLGE